MKQSYRRVWEMENQVGNEYRGAEIARNRLIAGGALSIWSGRAELRQQAAAFRVLEHSISPDVRREMIRNTLFDLMATVGCVFPFESWTTGTSDASIATRWKQLQATKVPLHEKRGGFGTKHN
jgi:hypothetical protein